MTTTKQLDGLDAQRKAFEPQGGVFGAFCVLNEMESTGLRKNRGLGACFGVVYRLPGRIGRSAHG